MHKINIYIECSDKSAKATEKMFGYVKIMPDGSKCRCIGHPQKITYHRATLFALYMAIRKLEDNYEIHLHTCDQYVPAMINTNLRKWEERDFKTVKQKDVTDADLWREIAKKLKYQKVVGHSERCEYHEMLEQLLEAARQIE